MQAERSEAVITNGIVGGGSFVTLNLFGHSAGLFGFCHLKFQGLVSWSCGGEL
jgi:hypothetical protein